MDTDSDEELPSLSAIVSRLQHQKLAVTSVTRECSPVSDPAEEAIVPKGKVKLRTTAVQPILRSTSKTKINGNATFTRAFGLASTSSKQKPQSTPLKTGSASKAVARLVEGSQVSIPVNAIQATKTRRAPAATSTQRVASVSESAQAGSSQEHTAAPPIHIQVDLFGVRETQERHSSFPSSPRPGHEKAAAPPIL